jgi:hypothetical protein
MVDFSGVQQHLTAITTAQTDYAKSSFEANKAYFESLPPATAALCSLRGGPRI